MILKLT